MAYMRTYLKQIMLSTMFPSPRIFPARFPAKALGREKAFPAGVRKSACKALILQDSMSEIAKTSLLFRLGREIHGVHWTGEGAPRSCLAAPPSLYLALGRRSVAQPGRALLSGGRGRRFKSSHSDQQNQILGRGHREQIITEPPQF